MDRMSDITRRGFVASGALAMLAAATAAGCAPADYARREAEGGAEGEPFDVLGGYLPLGSVVTLKGSEDLDLRFMIVSRRPDVTSVANDDGTRSAIDFVYDYAGVQWPLGFVTDLTLQAQGAECIAFNREDIVRIDFVGCTAGREAEAAEMLNAAYGTMDTCATVLMPMQSDIVSVFPSSDASEGGQ